MDYIKIQNALDLIKSVCAENKNCNNCPLRDPECYGSCYIFHRVPEELNLLNLKKTLVSSKNKNRKR